MKKLIFFMIALLIGQSVALPLFGPPQGFRNNGLVELGSLTIDGVDIDGGDISYDEFVAGMITNETAINDSIAALTLAAYTNETAINSSIAAQAVSQVVNETAINLSIISRSNGVQLSAFINETDINETIAAQAVSQVTNETAINTTAGNVALGQTWQNNSITNLQAGNTAQNTTATANKKSDYVNTTAINTSIAALTVPLVSFPYTADVVDQAVFTASGGWVLTAVRLTPTVAGTGEGAATVMIKICDSGEAPASGDAMLNSTLDLEGTIHVPQSGALTTYTGVSIPNGKIVALDFTGTLTSSVGSITLYGTRA